MEVVTYIQVSVEELQKLVAESTSYSQILRAVGRKVSGGNAATLSRRINKLGIDTSHFVRPVWKGGNRRQTADELLVVLPDGSDRTKRARLLRAMLEVGVVYACAICGLHDWQGRELTLQIDHIDGDWLNNRIENLRLLCPNCHTQTATWGSAKSAETVEEATVPIKSPRPRAMKLCECGRKIDRRSKACRSCSHKGLERIEWPTEAELSEMVQRVGYSAAGRQLGVSDNAIRKRQRVRSAA